MSAYFIARVNIQNKEKYQKYLEAVPPVISKFRGKPIVRTEKSITLEGIEENRRIIIIEFPSSDQAKAFYNSDEYQKVKRFRENAALGEIIIVEGI